MKNNEPTNFLTITWLVVKGVASHCMDSSRRFSARVASLQLQSSIIVFLLGITWVWLSASCDSIENIISNPFERSGSVLVLVAIYLDYSFRESAIIQISVNMQSTKYKLVAHYLVILATVVRPVSILAAIIGTLIWGYGSEF